jgi:RHS repeat-associated protein
MPERENKMKRKRAIIAIVGLLFLCNLIPLQECNAELSCWNDGSLAGKNGNNDIDGDGEAEAAGTPQPDNSKDKSDPVNLTTGNFNYNQTDIHLKSRGMPLELTRTYNSRDIQEGPFGYGWTHNYNIYLSTGVSDGVNTYVLLRHANGNTDQYVQLSGGSFQSPAKRYGKLIYEVNSSTLQTISNGVLNTGYRLTTKHGTNYVFTAAGQLRVIADRNSNRVKLDYDSGGKLIKITDTVGRVLTLTYTADKKISSIADYTGRSFQYGYDTKGNLISVTLPACGDYTTSLKTSYAYDDAHHLTGITDAKGVNYLQNKYDRVGRVVEQYVGLSVYRFTYYDGKTMYQDGRGYLTEYYFSADGSVQREVYCSANWVAISTVSYAYNANKELIKLTYPRGNSKEYTYDSNGNVTSVICKPLPGSSSANIVTQYTYDPVYSGMTRAIDAQGNTTTFEYDSHGNMTRVTYPIISGQVSSVQIAYDQYGQVQTVTNERGMVTKYEYDNNGNVVRIIVDYGDTSHRNETVSFLYDTMGNRVSMTDGNGHTTAYTYNSLYQLKEVTREKAQIKYQYDANGNCTKIEQKADDIGSKWQVEEFGYDSVDRLTEKQQYYTDGNCSFTHYEYDKDGNCSQEFDAKGNVVYFVYDECGRLQKCTDAENGVTAYGYDGNGNCISIQDARGNVTSYGYDDYDRLVKTTYPDGTYESFTRDKNGNITKKRTRKGEVITYVYDAHNRLKSKFYPDKGVKNYTYNVADQLTSARTSISTTTYYYDAIGRVGKTAQVTNGKTYNLLYEYDKEGLLKKLTYPDATYVNYTYDDMDCLERIADSLNNTIASYQYDVLLRRKQITYGNGLTTGYTYNMFNRLTALSIPGENLGYQYDRTNNAISMSNSNGKTNYEYGRNYQLLKSSNAAGVLLYVYDSVGNRITAEGKTYTTNNRNQYTQIDAKPIVYDSNGNLTAIDGWNLKYDYDNNLTQATGTVTMAVYQHDAFGRRIGKTVNNVATYFVYDGSAIIAEYNSAGTLLRKYVHGNTIDEPVQMVSGSNKYYYHADRLGSITSITDAAGKVVEKYQYSAFGVPKIINANGQVISQSAIGNRYQFTGREFDVETGFYYYRARHYSPTLGRFLQTDPIAIEGELIFMLM